MLGAIIGDIIGSRFEWCNCKSKKFPLFTTQCVPTDDSIMSLAICAALLQWDGKDETLAELVTKNMQSLGRKYPHCGFGYHFFQWITADTPVPYNSYGNGAAMRISGCAYVGRTLADVARISRLITGVTHNHAEGLKGGEAAALAVAMARMGKTKEEIAAYIQEQYYKLDFTLDAIREEYSYDVTCQGTVPQAIEAFLEAKDFEDAIRNAISIGGDSDTLAAITGSIAEAYFGIPNSLRDMALEFLNEELRTILETFEAKYPPKILP